MNKKINFFQLYLGFEPKRGTTPAKSNLDPIIEFPILKQLLHNDFAIGKSANRSCQHSWTTSLSSYFNLFFLKQELRLAPHYNTLHY